MFSNDEVLVVDKVKNSNELRGSHIQDLIMNIKNSKNINLSSDFRRILFMHAHLFRFNRKTNNLYTKFLITKSEKEKYYYRQIYLWGDYNNHFYYPILITSIRKYLSNFTAVEGKKCQSKEY